MTSWLMVCSQRIFHLQLHKFCRKQMASCLAFQPGKCPTQKSAPNNMPASLCKVCLTAMSQQTACRHLLTSGIAENLIKRWDTLVERDYRLSSTREKQALCAADLVILLLNSRPFGIQQGSCGWKASSCESHHKSFLYTSPIHTLETLIVWSLKSRYWILYYLDFLCIQVALLESLSASLFPQLLWEEDRWSSALWHYAVCFSMLQFQCSMPTIAVASQQVGLQEVTVLTSLSNFVHHGMIYIPPVSILEQVRCRFQLKIPLRPVHLCSVAGHSEINVIHLDKKWSKHQQVA